MGLLPDTTIAGCAWAENTVNVFVRHARDVIYAGITN